MILPTNCDLNNKVLEQESKLLSQVPVDVAEETIFELFSGEVRPNYATMNIIHDLGRSGKKEVPMSPFLIEKFSEGIYN